MARPKEFKSEYTEQLIEYFSQPPFIKETRTIVTKAGDPVEITEEVASPFPTLAGFAVKIGHHRDTLLEWSKEFEDFGYAYRMAKEHQENFLLVNGLAGRIEQPMTIFTLKNVCGYRDKQPGEADVVVNNFANKSDEELEKRKQELLAKQSQAAG